MLRSPWTLKEVETTMHVSQRRRHRFCIFHNPVSAGSGTQAGFPVGLRICQAYIDTLEFIVGNEVLELKR